MKNTFLIPKLNFYFNLLVFSKLLKIVYKKTTTQLAEELDYSRQCISRISKLFRDKLLSNPEFFDLEE